MIFTRSPMFMRFQRYGQQFSGNAAGGAWWLLMAPGLALTLLALAILTWPELLAYMVASVLLVAGMTLMLWSWRLRRVERRAHRNMATLQRDLW
jgi:Flp pilus assembly protein TadB